MENKHIYIMGIGLRGTGSLTLNEVNILRESDKIFIDSYTSIFPQGMKQDLEEISGRPVEFLLRDEVESFAFLNDTFSIVSFIVSGDPMSSTTHFAIVERCRELKYDVDIIENASIVTTIPGRTGLSPYRMGPVVSIPKIVNNFVPRSVARKIRNNMEWQLHGLLLVDLENGSNMDPTDVFKALHVLGDNILTEQFFEMPMMVLERVGWKNEKVYISTVKTLEKMANNSPYCMVLPMKPNINEIYSMRTLNLPGIEILERFDYESLWKMTPI